MINPPSALLFISSDCPHCPSVLQSLTELIKEARLSSIEIINISQAPQRAEALNIRSVPWLKIENFELIGLKSKTEILQWIDKAAHPQDMEQYFEELMTSNRMPEVVQLIEGKPEQIQSLLNIMANETSSLSARLGVAVIFEELAGKQILISNIDLMGQYIDHPSHRVRNDLAYYLGLTQHSDAIQYLSVLSQDTDKEVVDAAEEALQEIYESMN